jgi:trans-aconitate methyltransferase
MAARLRFPDASFAVGDILDRRMLQEIVSEPINTILSINVLEHIEDDSTAMAHLLSILKNGGYLLVSVPAMPLLYNDLDRLAGHFGAIRSVKWSG